jgi:hypothetical protein
MVHKHGDSITFADVQIHGPERREYERRDPPRLPRGTLCPQRVGTNFADKRRSVGWYSSLAESGHGVFLLLYRSTETYFRRCDVVPPLHSFFSVKFFSSGLLCLDHINRQLPGTPCERDGSVSFNPFKRNRSRTEFVVVVI